MRTHADAAKGLQSISPKQPAARRRRDWYPYYAGFTQRFVDAVISEHLREATFVVDPWSGSGTTTVSCLMRGVASKGLDINPALTVIARARLTPTTSRRTVERALDEVVRVARTGGVERLPPDLLDTWLSPGAAELVRDLRCAIHAVLGHDELGGTGEDLGADSLTPIVSFFYCALFGVVRKAVRRYGATNPMWLKNPPTLRHRARPSAKVLHEELGSQVEYLAHRLCLSGQSGRISTESPFATGNAILLPFGDDVFDGAITSPPYATRVDYVKGTLPELAVLGADEGYVDRLRWASTGSPTVRGSRRTKKSELESETAKSVVSAIESHSSKGSRSYYSPWMTNYLGALQGGLRELHRTVKENYPICIVVQDSYYKEVPIAVQRIVVEMMSGLGRELNARYDYSAPNPRRQLGESRESNDATPENIETLLVFS